MSHRIVLATLNARYMHASLGLRYLLANMQRHGGQAVADCAVLREFTIQTPPADIATALIAECGPAACGDVHVIGLGIYIWNVEQSLALVQALRAQRPDIRIVLGGPEVSHEPETQPIVALADHVITGWGDVSFPKLCKALLFGPHPLMKTIAGEQPPLDEIALPYAHYSETDLAQRVLYVEASRGCPFKCAFCLSALDKTAWAFELEAFLAALDDLYARGARTFKFVDRTFNLKMDASVRILEFFLNKLERDPDAPLFVHFELIPDQLPARLQDCIARFPAGVLQFEIGIQSLNPQVQSRISRRQDGARTAANVRWLVQHSQAHLHTDLIFGLPGESWASFAAGFDELWSWGPHEIQLGILKRLRGTPLAQQDLAGHPLTQGMVYDRAPPYTVLQTDAVSAAELQAFTRLARYWDLVANSGRFGRSLPLLMQGPSAFAAFADFAAWLWTDTGSTAGLTPERLTDALFDYLCGPRQSDPATVRAALLADYLASGARAKPHCLRDVLPRTIATTARASQIAARQRLHRGAAPVATLET